MNFEACDLIIRAKHAARSRLDQAHAFSMLLAGASKSNVNLGQNAMFGRVSGPQGAAALL